MANNKRPQAPKGTTFKAKFKWPKLNEPDYGTKEFPKPDGEFSVKAVGQVNDPDVQAFIAKWQPVHDEAIKRAEEEFKKLPIATRKKLEKVTVNPLYTELYDEECQSAFKFDPVSASNFDPFERRALTVALASSELAGVAETWRARAA